MGETLFPEPVLLEKGIDHGSRCAHGPELAAVASRKSQSIQTSSHSSGEHILGKMASLSTTSGHEAKGETGMSWWQAATVMLAETVSLGILSLPTAVSTVGLLPGSLLIIGFGFITTYTGYEVYRFKIRFPQINSFAEAGALIAGPIGRWTVEIMQMAMLIFIMAGHIVIFRNMILHLAPNNHVCGVMWTVVALAINIACTLPRALQTNSWFSIFSCVSIIAATLTAIGSVAIDSSHHFPSKPIIKFGENIQFASAMAGLSNILVSYSGHIAYFNIISEMENPRDFPKALFTTSFITMALYTITGVVLYSMLGNNVKSPALDSASAAAGKAAYALAIPTIVVAGVIAALVAAKRAYNIAWKRRPSVTRENTARAWASWIAIVVSLWTISWLIANVIPWFSTLLAIIGAAVGTWICLGFPAIFWMYGSWEQDRKALRWKVLLGVNLILLLMSFLACVLGLFGGIVDFGRENSSGKPFSCRDGA